MEIVTWLITHGASIAVLIVVVLIFASLGLEYRKAPFLPEPVDNDVNPSDYKYVLKLQYMVEGQCGVYSYFKESNYLPNWEQCDAVLDHHGAKNYHLHSVYYTESVCSDNKEIARDEEAVWHLWLDELNKTGADNGQVGVVRDSQETEDPYRREPEGG